MTDFTQHLGPMGRMLSLSKSGYRAKHPSNIAIFNANVCTLEGKQWYGDLDLTIDKNRLSELATSINQPVFVLYEMDARFENEESPKLDDSAVIFKPDGSWLLGKKLKPLAINHETLTYNGLQ